MLQLELYVADVGKTADLLISVFELTTLTKKSGFQHLSHTANFDIMLFNPSENGEGESHWPLPQRGMGGQGIEIVLVTTQVEDKLSAVRGLGYECSGLRHTPWGSIEFTFSLPEGYLLRVKELKNVSKV